MSERAALTNVATRKPAAAALKPVPAVVQTLGMHRAEPAHHVHPQAEAAEARHAGQAPGRPPAGTPRPPADAGTPPPPRDFTGLGVHAPGNIVDHDVARALLTRVLLDELAASFGLDPKRIKINVTAPAEARTNAAGASGLQSGATIYLHPARFRPATVEGRRLLAHEAAHAAQRELSAKPDLAAAEAEAAELADAFATRAPLRRPKVALPQLVVAHDTGAVPELPFETMVEQNHQSELARIHQLLGGLWISDGDVDKVLLILKTVSPPAAVALVRMLSSTERVDLVDNMHSGHRKGARTEVLLCYAALGASEVYEHFDEDLFDDMKLDELDVQQAFWIAGVVKNLKPKAQTALRKGDNGAAIRAIEKFTNDPDNLQQLQEAIANEQNKALEEERELAKTRKETENVGTKDQREGGKLEKLIGEIRELLDSWVVTDNDALSILDKLLPYAHDEPTLRFIADGLVTHHYKKEGDAYQYSEDKDYLQELIDQVPVKALYDQASPQRRVFLQLLVVRPGYKSIESVLKLTDEVDVKTPIIGLFINAIAGFFSHVDSEEAYLAYQLVRSMPPRARRAIMEYDDGASWGKVRANMSVSQFNAATTNIYQGGKNGSDRNALLAQLMVDDIWADAMRLRGVVGMALAAGHYDWVFAESQSRFNAKQGYANDDVLAVAEMYKLYNPNAVNAKGDKAPRVRPDSQLIEGNPFWNEGNLGWINQKVIGGLDFIFSSKDVEAGTTALGGTGLNLAEFQDITGGTFLGARFENLDKLGMEGAEAKRRQKGINFANVQWDRNLGVLKLQADHLAIAAINYPLAGQTIRTGRIDLRNVDVTLRYPTESTKNQLNVIEVTIGEAEVDDLMLISPDDIKSVNQLDLSGLRLVIQPAGKDVSQLSKPRDGLLVDGVGGLFANILLFPMGGAAGVGAAVNVVGAAGSGKELGNNILKPSGGMQMDVSLRSLKLSGISTSGGSYVESVVIENLDIGGGGTVDSYLTALEVSAQRLTTRLQREHKAEAAAGDDKERSTHRKAAEQLARQIAHANAEVAEVRKDQARIAALEAQQSALGAEKPPKQLTKDERDELKRLKGAMMGTVVDVGRIRVKGVANAPLKDLDLANLHGQGRATTALLAQFTESDTLSRFIEGGQPTVKEKKNADFAIDIGHVELPDLVLKGGIPKAEDAAKDVAKFRAKMDPSRTEHAARLELLEDRAKQATVYEGLMQRGPATLSADDQRKFVAARRYLEAFEETNALRIQSVTLDGASLHFDTEGRVGLGADELNAVGLVDPKTGLRVDSVHARKFKLDARVKDGIFGLKDWRKNLQSGELSAGYLQVKGFDDPESGLGADEIVAESEDDGSALVAGLATNGGNASAHVKGPKISVRGASAAFSERVLRITQARLMARLADKALDVAKRTKGKQLLDDVNDFLKNLDAVKEAIASDQTAIAVAKAAGDDKKREAAAKDLAMDQDNLKTWLRQLSLRQLSVKDLDLSLRGLGAVLDDNWSFDNALEGGVTFEAGKPGGAIAGGVTFSGLNLRQAGRKTLAAEEVSTGPIKGSVTYAKAFIRIDGLNIEHITVAGTAYMSPEATVWAEGATTLTNVTVSALIHAEPRPAGNEGPGSALSKVEVTDFHIDRIDADRLGYEDRAGGMSVKVTSGALRDISMRGLSFEFSPDELDAMKIKEDQHAGTKDKPTGINVGHFDNIKLGATLAGGLTMGGRVNASALSVHFAESGGKEIDLASVTVAEGKVKKGDLSLDADADIKGIHVSVLPGGLVKGRARDVSVGVSGTKGKHGFAGRIEHADTGEVTYDGDWVTMPALDLPSIKLTQLSVLSPDLELNIPAGQDAELIGTKASVSLELNNDPKHGATPVRRVYIQELKALGLALHAFTLKIPSLDLTVSLPYGLSGFIGDLYLKPGAEFPEGFIIEPEPGDFPLGKGFAYGTFGFKTASLIKLNANIKSVLDASANLKADGFELGFLNDGSITVDLQKLTGDNVAGTIHAAKLAGSKFSFLGALGAKGSPPGLEATGIHYDKDKFSIEGATVRGVRFSDPAHGISVTIDEAGLPVDAAGKPAFEWPKVGPARVPKLDVRKAHFDIDFTKSKGGAAAPAKSGPWNFGFLDQLNGSLSTDVFIPGLTVKVSAAAGPFAGGTDIPVPTDTFPIQMFITDGVIDFAKLEKKAFSNSTTVQTLLDFEVKGNKLVLEADFSDAALAVSPAPGGLATLLGATKKDVIEWELKPFERVMADDDQVRLATLAVGIMEFVNAPTKVNPNFRVDVDAHWSDLELRNVLAQLSMKGGGEIDLAGVTGDPSVKGRITLGGPGRDAIKGLTAKGGSKRGVDIGLEHADLGVKGLDLGGMGLDIGRIEVDGVHDVVFKMASGKPASLSGSIDSATGTDVKLTK